jgi:hypothetical protein
MQGRRKFLKSTAALLAASWLPEEIIAMRTPSARIGEGESLPAPEVGGLEIHHIDTGRGNATFILGPDGTSLLIDAGEAHSLERTMSPARPDKSRRAGQWIARYMRRQLERTTRNSLDVMLLTHLHGDHVGEVADGSPLSSLGNYRLTGAADVAEAIHVNEMLDRGWPDYTYPAPPKDPTSLNYIELARSMAKRGTTVRRARAGSVDQLALRHNASGYPNFRARILSVNGEVWTGSGEAAKAMFPSQEDHADPSRPSENMCSVSVRIQYGAFRYYSGGDLTCDTEYGRLPWRDIETAVAHSAGPVSVAVANHHGYFDACGPAMVRALRPRVWVLPTWHVSHPAMNVMANIFSTELYPGERSVFAVGMTPEAMLTTERFSGALSSSDGHVVIRVPPDGREFSVYVVDARDESGTVVKSFGPFAA